MGFFLTLSWRGRPRGQVRSLPPRPRRRQRQDSGQDQKVPAARADGLLRRRPSASFAAGASSGTSTRTAFGTTSTVSSCVVPASSPSNSTGCGRRRTDNDPARLKNFQGRVLLGTPSRA